eukprot:COSAG06_NODE_12716_length_1339_cov_2.558065_1_plen_70_part_10
MMILPRQARDKHRKTQKSAVFLQGRIESAKLALKNKLGFGYRLPQLFCGTKRLPLEWKANDEGAAVSKNG